MAEMTFDGTFSDLKMKVMSESALQAIYPELVKLSDFAHTYTDLVGHAGESIVIPTYDLSAVSEFDANSNNYGSGQQEVTASNVTLDKHLIKAISITDRELGATGINWLKDAAAGMATVMGKGLNAYVMGLFNSTNCPISASFDCGTKAQPTINKLYEIAASNGLDVGDSIVILDPKNYTDLLGVIDYAMYGGREAVKFGFCDGLFGFKKVVCSTYLPEGVNGVIVNRNSVGIASRAVEPLAGAYPAAWQTVDPDSGFTLGWRLFADLASGVRKFAVDALVGAKVFYGGKYAIRLINS